MKILLSSLFSIFFFASFLSQNTIWGTAVSGGNYNSGYLYRTDSVGNHLTIVHHFKETIDGKAPGPVIQASNGKLYGMTTRGGQGVVLVTGPNGSAYTYGGTLFEYDPVLDSLKTLQHFNATDPQYPAGFDNPSSMKLLEVSAGKLWCVFNVSKNSASVTQSVPRYITAYTIATNSMSPVVMLPSWTTPALPGATVHTSFTGQLYKDANGKVYGTTAGYSSCATTTDANNGSIISINPANNAFSFIRPFSCLYVYGWLPESALTEVNGKLYGTTRWGGPAISLPTNFGNGVLYEYDPLANTYTPSYNFAGGNMGYYPNGSLVKAANGKLYGTTFYGTPYTNFPNGSGVLYEYDVATNNYIKKYDFTDGSIMDVGINGSLWLKAHNGNLYGTTAYGLFEYNVATSQVRAAGRFQVIENIQNPVIEVCRKPSYKLNSANAYTVCEGSLFNYDLHCSNASSFVWTHNGITDPLQSNSALNFSAITAANSGTWACTMTNECGVSVSPTLTLTVNPAGSGLTTSSITPAGHLNICPGNTITLSGNTGGVWNNGSSATSINVSQPGSYQITNTNACGLTFSNIVVIDTIPSPVTPAITFATNSIPILVKYICPGDSALLTGNISGGLWNTGESTSTIYVKDNLPHYIINANQCKTITSATAQVVFIMPPAPPVISQTGPIQICKGDSVLVNATATLPVSWYRILGGNYSYVNYGNSVYIKQTGDYYAMISGVCENVYSQPLHINADTLALDTAIITASGTLTFCPGGSVTLTSNYAHCVWSTRTTATSITVNQSGNYYVTNSNSCSSVVSAITSVSVITTSTITYNEPNATVCPETPPFTLAAGSPAGGYYTGSGVTGNTFDPVLAGSGTHTITYTLPDASTNCNSIATQTVFVDYNPTVMLASPSNSICAGVTAVLIQQNGYGTWNTGQTGAVLTTTLAGDYYVSLTNSCGHAVSSNTVQIIILPLPPTPTITQNGSVLTASTGQAYQWYFNGSVLVGATSQTYAPTQDGNYTVYVSGPNGCYTPSAVYPFVVTGVEQLYFSNQISLFPNPTSGHTVIRKAKGNARIIITNSIGETMYDLTSDDTETSFQFNTNGVYIVQIISNNFSGTQRLIVSN